MKCTFLLIVLMVWGTVVIGMARNFRINEVEFQNPQQSILKHLDDIHNIDS